VICITLTHQPRCIDGYCLIVDLRGVLRNVLMRCAAPRLRPQSNRESTVSVDVNTTRQICKIACLIYIAVDRRSTETGNDSALCCSKAK